MNYEAIEIRMETLNNASVPSTPLPLSVSQDIIATDSRDSSVGTSEILEYRDNERREFITTETEFLAQQGKSRAEVKEILTEKDQLYCKPPFGKTEVERIIDRCFGALLHAGIPDGAGARYSSTKRGLYKTERHDNNADERLVRLTNFIVDSIQQVVSDNGAEKQYSLQITARRKHDEPAVTEELSNDEFQKMNWPLAMLGPGAAVLPYKNQEAKFGIELTAKKLPTRYKYTHTGWRKIDGKTFYLHASGAIGSEGSRYDIKAALPSEKLNAFSLPDPPKEEEEKSAIRASLRFLDVADDAVSLPLLAAVYRAPLGDSAMTVFTSGSTGLFKTETTKLAQQHFGKDFGDERNILHWDSTSNALKESLFHIKDATAFIDEFVPSGGTKGYERAHAQGEQVLRSVANLSGRARLNRDGKLQEAHEPRALLLSTGEDRPRGHSLAARTVHLSVSRGTVNKEQLTACQKDAHNGLYAQSVSGYINWLAKRYDGLSGERKTRVEELRNYLAAPGRHAKSVQILADLAIGFEYFLSYAEDAGAPTTEQAYELWARLWRAFSKLAIDQDQIQSTQDPLREVLQRLKSAEASGKIYLQQIDPAAGEQVLPPLGAKRVGWREENDNGTGEDWFCDPETLYTEAVRLYREQNANLPWEKPTLWERLRQAGLTKTNKGRNDYRKRIKGEQRWVIYIPATSFKDSEAENEGMASAEGESSVPARMKR